MDVCFSLGIPMTPKKHFKIKFTISFFLHWLVQLVRKEEKDEPMNDEDAADDEHGQVKKQEEGLSWTCSYFLWWVTMGLEKVFFLL